MVRALLEQTLDPAALDRLFKDTATKQYTREVLFSSLVKLMASVVCGVEPSVRAAYLSSLGEIAASLSAVYVKLQGVEVEVCRALVAEPAVKLAALVHALGGTMPQPVPGYRAKVLDGNHLAGTEHRPKPTRTTGAAVLPGQSLAVLDLETRLVVDVVPWEDAHTQERALIDFILPKVGPGDLWIDDRNFCTTRFIFGVRGQGGSFLVRQHKSTLYWEETTPWTVIGRTSTGLVHEQTIRVRTSNADDAETMDLRRIRLDLDRPTEDKETEIFLLTDVPQDKADALLLCETYRLRWRIENVFQTLTEALTCEIDTLAYPKAALFGFCVAVVMYNVLAVVRAALRAEHGRETVEAKVSNYFLANEVARTYEGMMIALPPAEWTAFQTLSVSELAEFLREVASQVWLAKYPRTVRGPKKPRPKRTSGKIDHHVSTARLLLERNQQK